MTTSSTSHAPASPSNRDNLTTKHEPITDAIYRDGQLTWASGKLGDVDIITVTSIEGRENGHLIWSLAPAHIASDPNPPPLKLQSISATSLPEKFLEQHRFQTLPAPLDPNTRAVYVLISTRSGTGLALNFFSGVLRPLLRAVGLADSTYHVVQTEDAESIKRFAQSTLLHGANTGSEQTVLLLSGDGGTVDIINGLLEAGDRSSTYVTPVITLFPLGTGNALFHSIHRPSMLPSIYIQGLRTLLRGKPRALPTFRASFSPGARSLSNEGQTATPLPNGRVYGAVVASYGLHATLVADSDTTEYRKHGDKRFGLVAKDLMYPGDGSAPHAYKADVTLFKSGERREVIARKDHGYILATPLSNLERAFTISPSSTPLDGQLRIVHFGAISGDQTMEIMKEAYNAGNHTTLDVVSYESIDGLRVDLKEEGADWKWRRFCIDGLIVGVEENGWMEVQTVEEGGEAVCVLVDL